MSVAGIVLAGGRSSRMGTAKAHLAWHGDTFLGHIVATLHRSVDGPVIVVAAPGQRLPALPAQAEVTHDPVEGRGPLQGIVAGLAAARDRSDRAFVCSTDLPLLHPAYVAAVLTLLDSAADVALPHVRGHRQPLAAAYRTELADLGTRLLDQGARRPGQLFARCRVRHLDATALLAVGELARADPQLRSVENVNTPEDYERLLRS